MSTSDGHSDEPGDPDDDRGVRLRVDDVEDPISHLVRGEIEIALG